jgi:c-di-GMP-binding flagellar brake protein YcgR
VEEVREDSLVLVPSVSRGADVVAASRAAAVVEWVTRRGRVVLPARVVGEEQRDRLRALVVEPAGDPNVIQRRGHVRAVSDLKVEIEAGGRRLQAVVEDMSGGGIRARLEGWPLSPGQQVSLRIPLDDGAEVEADARVMERYGQHHYGMEFTFIEDADRERLIRHVFHRLRISARLDEP